MKTVERFEIPHDATYEIIQDPGRKDLNIVRGGGVICHANNIDAARKVIYNYSCQRMHVAFDGHNASAVNAKRILDKLGSNDVFNLAAFKVNL